MSLARARPRAFDGFGGDLLAPGDAGYETARRVHNGAIDKLPALIARCRSTADVVAAVRYAASDGLEVSVRGGGHNVAGTAVTDGGLMIDLAAMRIVDVDAGRRRARVAGGATWGELDAATQRHGLAVTGGMISSTGIAGLTLGGGLWHATSSVRPRRQQGYCLARRHARLGIEAGGDLTANAALLHAPDGSGAMAAGVLGCHLADASAAASELARFRDLDSPLEVEIGPIEYCELNAVLDAKYPRGALNYWKSAFLSDLSDGAIDMLVEQFEQCPSTMTTVVIEHLHGAVTRVPLDATAVPRRDGYNLVITSVWRDQADTDANVAWTREVFARMEPFTSSQTYSNYLAADELDRDRVADAFGSNYARLVEVKNEYDPGNLFRLNQNIKPSSPRVNRSGAA